MTRKAMVTLVSGLALVCGVIAPVGALGGESRSYAASSRQDSATEIARRLVGTWRLESAVLLGPDGQVAGYPLTRNPEGKLTYTRDGHMWAYTGARGRGERQALWYTGRFRIDLRRREVVHRARYSSIRSWEGTDLRRRYRFDGPRRLTLTTVEGGRLVLRWVRTGAIESFTRRSAP